MARVKSIGAAIKSREEMERLIRELCTLTIWRDEQKVEMDKELAAVRSAYEPPLAELNAKIDAAMALARDWAEANETAFGDRKSIDMVHGTVGFRTGTPKLKTLTGWTWERVKAFLVNNSLGFTRTELSVDKEEILARREKLGEGKLREMGLKVVQDESFFVEPNRTAMEQRLAEGKLA